MEDLTVSASWPVYDGHMDLQGVMGTHMLLSDIGLSLERAVENYGGYAIIFEKETGSLVANSIGTPNFTVLQDGSLKRHTINENENSSLQYAYEQYLTQNDYHYSSKKQNKERLYVNIREVRMEGLDWIVLSAIPGNPLLNHVFDSMYLTALLVLLTILISVIVYYFVTQKLFKPVENLLRVADSLSSGDLTKRATVVRDDEIGSISRSFNSVADKLQFPLPTS